MKKKVSAYSKKIMELSIQIKESAMGGNVNLEDELNKLAILNEELQKKVDIINIISTYCLYNQVSALEQQLEEANKKVRSDAKSMRLYLSPIRPKNYTPH
jgi:hypothetical protein